VIIQSMTNTKTKEVPATVAQIEALAKAGCQLVRVAVVDESDARAIKEIKQQISLPLVCDIHFNYRLALICIENGADKIRLNPGNIEKQSQVEEVVNACKKHQVPIRIGINAGSLPLDLLGENKQVSPAAMIAAAKRHVDILEALDFYDIVLSFKASEVPLTIEAYQLASQTFPYPLHLGVTEAGTRELSAIKSSAALGTLLSQSIGDTLRISVSDDPLVEIDIAKKLLNCFHLATDVPDLISCPTCGRLEYDMLPIVREIEDYLKNVHKNITVAIMGCPVNGPQEASRADIGVAGGYHNALLFKKGQIIRRIAQNEIVEVLKKEIQDFKP